MRKIADLKTVLSVDPVAAVVLFDKIVKEDDESQISSACETLANYIRHSSIYKRRLVFQQLLQCSILSRLYLSMQFNKFDDSSFPKNFIFKGYSINGESSNETDNSYAIAVGSNRCFNLGLISDGSPVLEPRVIDLPSIVQIEMSNSHTVFLTEDNKLYGCGKSASFLPDQIGEASYTAEPTMIKIPETNDIVEKIRVIEGGTQFLIGGKWYFVGKLPHKTEMKRLSTNCHVSTAESTPNVEIPEYQETNVRLDGKNVKIYVRNEGFHLQWDLKPSFTAPKSVELVINGFLKRDAEICSFQVLNDGTIYIQRNIMLKGKLELWRNADDGFQVKEGTAVSHFDTKYTLVAILEEMPVTFGIILFKVSPDGQNMIMKKVSPNNFYDFPWKSNQPHGIIKERAEVDPVDIPMDLTLIFEFRIESEFVECDDGFFTLTQFPMNRLLFEMLFPQHVSKIVGNEVTFPGNIINDEEYCEIPFDDDIQKYSSPEEFLPANTPPESILYLISKEGERIACHKYIHILHSRQFIGFQRFQVYSHYGDMVEAEEKPLELEAMATSQTVKNALRGMLDLRSLHLIKPIELIECLHFYDYHLMFEMFSDAMHILMMSTTEYTLPLLYTLFEYYPEAVVDGLVKRRDLITHSANMIERPPKDLLVRFAEKVKDQFSYKNTHSNNLLRFEPEYVIPRLLNLDEDFEEVVWSTLRFDFSNSLDKLYAEAMAKKEEKAPRTRSRSSQQGLSMTSSPIPIGGQTQSVSASSPIAQSPLAFSMSPMTKALPITKPRHDSISNSFEDFPTMGSPIPSSSTPKSAGRFAPKGVKFRKDQDILKTPPVANPWKGGGVSLGVEASTILEEEVKLDEVMRSEETLQRNIRTGNREVLQLAHVETEQLAMIEILDSFQKIYGDNALVRVELVNDNVPVNNAQWGSMPGLVRR